MDILEEDYQKAVAVVRKCLSGSVSNLQRKLYWGYGRAASAIDRMQDEFIVSPMAASGRRDVYPEETHELWKKLQAAKAQAVPEGFILIKDDTKTVVAIERMVEQQVEASGMDSRRLERLDGWKIIEAAVKAQEPQITELKVEWASDCFKCGHHEAIIYSTAAEASTKGWFHDGDEVKCTGCGNTGEMDARGEDSDICWNEDEAND
ncbi:DNA translocase FtsK [Acinetobacter schindleri]|jgi:ribosomal protein S27E|uniref:DNA translocase FtsK n=1 Tax=Acinetobacter schindleri TaxID=108981 RepID=UPI002899F930|nr:DNA translocase FtsK [Acinetobacter schindleri]